MKVTDVKAYPLKTRTALVRVSTDAGVEGIGECSPMNVPVMCHFVETALRPIVIGRDPLDTERLWDAMYYGTHKLGTGGVQPSCIAGVDIALWDIKGKASASRSIGSSAAPSARRSPCTSRSAAAPTWHRKRCSSTCARPGTRASRRSRSAWTGTTSQDVDPEKDLAMFRLCRDFLPAEIPLSFDANNGYTVPTAIRQGRKLEALGAAHFEEPVAPTNYGASARSRTRWTCPSPQASTSTRAGSSAT